MRLSSLKLSGFKSFADSTTLHFKDNRTAVVGPNGCGKSNVIDAIRWVMGESSARQLRGGSMQDVIFTGTANRKPVGVASVELRFDNTYGKLGGAYNAYSELSVRRQVNRDGKSDYFLNGTRCRRRDITDIFLGTGLGPRSYAIIEQGMISRLVDAKPDEMRIFVEEAAGVSRYQARRRETLQHLEQAEQNLSRLHDIDSELEKQLKTLERQVKTAIQYKQLEQEIHRLKVEMLSYQIEQNQQQQTQYQQQLTALSDEFKDVRVELHKLDSEWQHRQTEFQKLLQQSAPLQTEWQNAEKVLAELTTQVVQKKNLYQQYQQQLQQLEQQQQHDREKLQLLDIQLEQFEQNVEHFEQLVRQTQQQSHHTQQQFNALKQQQLQQLTELKQQQQQLEQYQAKQHQYQVQHEHLNKQILRLEQQQHTLKMQLQQLKPHTVDERDFATEQQALEIQLAELTTQLEQAVLAQQHAETQQQQQNEQYQAVLAQIKILTAEQKNLSGLMVKSSSQQQALPRLVDCIQLHDDAKTHTTVLEKVLSSWVNALVLKDEPLHAELARQIQLNQAIIASSWHSSLKDYPCLADWVIEPKWSYTQQIRIVEQVQHAISLQNNLSFGQMLLSLDGYLVGQDWQIALWYDEESATAQGSISHRLRLDEIAQELTDLQQQAEVLQQQVAETQQQVVDMTQQVKQFQQQQKTLQHQQQQLQIDVATWTSQQTAVQRQQQQLQEQLQQLDLQLEEDRLQRDELEIDSHAMLMKIEQLRPDVQAKQLQLDDLEQQLDDVQQQLTQQQQHAQTVEKDHINAQQQLELLAKDQSFLQQQRQKAQEQSQYLNNSLIPLKTELPDLQQTLDEQAQRTVELQQTWQAWQDDLNIAQQQQQQCSELRQQQQQKDEELRQKLEDKRLAWQSVKSDVEHQQQQLAELHHELITGLNINLTQHQQQLADKQAKFEKIGAVNLIASEEYQEIQQRHQELSHQIQDVEKTVQQLRDAMKSIDQETKSLFMKTFNEINHELQLLFPKIFNGGEASLTLEDDWQSGVKLMARPPGKRNSSLALLSGGEKALTALALVFAIFRLNPAPFCVLDEVDAPLDDANVQRFCNLVKELSTQVQFIYITHNKLAMTMATDLLGVTMPEAGTSKLVSVSIDEAKEFGLMSEN